MSRPILFSSEMVRAILDGRKTQTRRVIKPQPDGMMLTNDYDGYWFEGIYEPYNCPYGNKGDYLWVRETFQLFQCTSIENKEWDVYPYTPKEAVDSGEIGRTYGIEPVYKASRELPDEVPWRPSIFMPKQISRIQLEITDVWVEKVQDITVEDIMAEGIEGTSTPSPVNGEPNNTYTNGDGLEYNDPRSAFEALWDSINSDKGYPIENNPWVWVTEFESTKKGITNE